MKVFVKSLLSYTLGKYVSAKSSLLMKLNAENNSAFIEQVQQPVPRFKLCI